MKIFDMGPIKRLSRVIRPWLCTLLCDQLHHSGVVWSMIHLLRSCVLSLLRETQVVDMVYPFCDCPPDCNNY